MTLCGLLSYARRYWRKGLSRKSQSLAFLALDKIMSHNPRKARPTKRKTQQNLVVLGDDEVNDDDFVCMGPLGYYGAIAMASSQDAFCVRYSKF